ncbi:MAG: glycine--tRNA ligase subunit beta [Gammaproteobacteria bacterium]|nr:glycine--tRNA ligase subunit beta [Gammaproteobacteria bacterium]
MKTNDFLFEILTEELPPKNLLKLSNSLMDQVRKGLATQNLNFASIQPFATPRRLAFLITELEEQQPEQHIEKKGPSLSAAFDANGIPTNACIGFARSCGVSPKALEKLHTEKGSFVVFKNTLPGKTVAELLPEIIANALKKLPIAKLMRWGDQDIAFVRPVHSVMMLYGKKVIPANILGMETSNKTRGHRFLCRAPLEIHEPKDYEHTLKKKGYVIADFAKRKEIIVNESKRLVKKFDAHIVADEALINEVTAIVEWPVALLASFPERFLKIPHEALISSIQKHQKCFPMTDRDGKLLNHFITISNIESKDPKQVIVGNERVMNARLSDAAFFYYEDLKRPLSSLREKLQTVIFQTQLGSLADKTQRVSQLARIIAQTLQVDENTASKAAELSKCDLMTQMVEEFPELQGIMGKYYAQHEKLPDEIACALDEKYMPRHSGDNLPKTITGQILGIADRIDTLVGFFGINKIPTGDKDPFALRRAALSVLRILIENKLPLDLMKLLQQAKLFYGSRLMNKEVVEQTFEFTIERLKSYAIDFHFNKDALRACEFTVPQFMAVAAKKIPQPLDFQYRLVAVEKFSKLPEAKALAAANKRVNNILQKQTDDFSGKALNETLLIEPAEKALAELLSERLEEAKQSCEEKKYEPLLRDLAALKEPVDRFFNDVMVMTNNEAVRKNRLTLLTQLRELFSLVADISLLPVE